MSPQGLLEMAGLIIMMGPDGLQPPVDQMGAAWHNRMMAVLRSHQDELLELWAQDPSDAPVRLLEYALSEVRDPADRALIRAALSIHNESALRIWRFKEAPPKLQALAQKGENRLLLAPDMSGTLETLALSVAVRLSLAGKYRVVYLPDERPLYFAATG